jgi:hypothetical protein
MVGWAERRESHRQRLVTESGRRKIAPRAGLPPRGYCRFHPLTSYNRYWTPPTQSAGVGTADRTLIPNPQFLIPSPYPPLPTPDD